MKKQIFKKIIFLGIFLLLFIKLKSAQMSSEIESSIACPGSIPLHVNKDKCSVNSCSDYLIGQNYHCTGKMDAYWDDEKKICCCSCSELEPIITSKPRSQTNVYPPGMQLNLPLQGLVSRPAVIELAPLTGSTIVAPQTPLVTVKPSYDIRRIPATSRFLVVQPRIFNIGR